VLLVLLTVSIGDRVQIGVIQIKPPANFPVHVYLRSTATWLAGAGKHTITDRPTFLQPADDPHDIVSKHHTS